MVAEKFVAVRIAKHEFRKNENLITFPNISFSLCVLLQTNLVLFVFFPFFKKNFFN